MRAVSLTAFLVTAALAGPGARPARAGEDAKPAAPAEVAPRPAASRYQLVEILPKAKQALVYDRDRGTFVVVRAGDVLGDLTVAAIARDAMSLRPSQSDAKESREYVLYPTPLGDEAEDAEVEAAGQGLVDPYSAEILDPYGTEGVREVTAPEIHAVTAPKPAPVKPAAPMATVIAPAATIAPPLAAAPPAATPAPAPVASPTGSPSPSPTPTLSPTPSPSPSPSPTPSPSPSPTPSLSPTPSPSPSPAPAPAPAGPLMVSRAEIDAAVSDFDRLGRDIDASLGLTGVSVARVAPGSLFHRLGLRAGDRVTAVDGRPVRTLDEAAALYARLSTATKLSVDVTRGTEKITLRLQVTK